MKAIMFAVLLVAAPLAMSATALADDHTICPTRNFCYTPPVPTSGGTIGSVEDLVLTTVHDCFEPNGICRQ